MAENLAFQNTKEEEAWEMFEVGSMESVIQMASRKDASPYLQHLGLIAKLDLDPDTKFLLSGKSVFSSFLESYLFFQNGNSKEAVKSANVYISQNQFPISFTIASYLFKMYRETNQWKEALVVTLQYRKKFHDNAFLKEELEALFYSGKHSEVVSLFRNHFKELEDSNSLKYVGLSLYHVGKYDESRKVLEKIPDRLTLPTFEEKKNFYSKIMTKITDYEKKIDQLGFRELEDVGFAYLFHGEYKKAENSFRLATSKLELRSSLS